MTHANKIALAIITGVLFLLPVLSAENYYLCSNSGNDEFPGDREQPFRTLQRLSREDLRDGDMIRLKAGSFWREELELKFGDLPDKRFVVEAYGEGNPPVINGSDRFHPRDWKRDGKFWGVKIEAWDRDYFGVRQGVLFLDGSPGERKESREELQKHGDFLLEEDGNYLLCFSSTPPGEMESEITRRNGIGFASQSSVTIRGIAIERAVVGIGIWQADDWVIEGCVIRQVVTDGIHANGSEKAPNRGIVRHCRFTDWALKAKGRMRHDYANWSENEKWMGYGVHVFKGHDWVVEDSVFDVQDLLTGMDASAICFDNAGHAKRIARNKIYDAGRLRGPSCGILLWAPSGDGDVLIEDNEIYQMGGMGISVQDFTINSFQGRAIIRGNMLDGVCLADPLDGEAIRVWAKNSSENWVVDNRIKNIPAGKNPHPAIRFRESRGRISGNEIGNCPDDAIVLERKSVARVEDNLFSAVKREKLRVSKDSEKLGVPEPGR